MAAQPLQPRLAGEFDVDGYWRANGKYIAGPGAVSDEHKLVESILAAMLPNLGAKDVLDVGCGRGRLADLLKRSMPDVAYAGVDIGEAQIAATKLIRPDGEFYLSRLQDFAPLREWDLVLASEVLMHIPPNDIGAVCDKLKGLARKWIVTIDWTEPVPEPIAPWNWLYDYPALFGSVEKAIPVYQQTIYFIRP